MGVVGGGGIHHPQGNTNEIIESCRNNISFQSKHILTIFVKEAFWTPRPYIVLVLGEYVRIATFLE